jgi:hypothetical protein
MTGRRHIYSATPRYKLFCSRTFEPPPPYAEVSWAKITSSSRGANVVSNTYADWVPGAVHEFLAELADRLSCWSRPRAADRHSARETGHP